MITTKIRPAKKKSTMLKAVAARGGISRGKYILFITPELLTSELLIVLTALEKVFQYIRPR
jgi:hypothetical protein